MLVWIAVILLIASIGGFIAVTLWNHNKKKQQLRYYAYNKVLIEKNRMPQEAEIDEIIQRELYNERY